MNDVFISYAHLDDQALSEGQKGWISKFHHSLKVRLGQLLGEDPRIWRDPKLKGNDLFDETIMNQLPQVKALVSVLSPRYAKSEWCARELQEFIKAAEQTGGLRVHEKCRIFKVIKTPVPTEDYPENLINLFNSLLGYEFFEMDAETGRLREYDEELGIDAKRRYLEKVYDLAHEISQLLRAFNKPTVQTSPFNTEGKKVYLAEPTSDLIPERDRIRRELVERGHTVLPDRPLPLVGDELKETIASFLSQCELSVHLIGNRFGIVPEGEETSLAEIQISLAGAQCKAASLKQVIWLQPETNPEEERQKAFLQHINDGTGPTESAELIQGTVEQLKSICLKRLTTTSEQPATEPKNSNVKSVYLICDRTDERAVEPLEDFLFDQGFDVRVPQFDGNEADFEMVHWENLKSCDAVLIYWGEAGGQWVEMKQMDLLKAPGYGREKPYLAQAVFIGTPSHRRKERYRSRNSMIIRSEGVFEPECMKEFVKIKDA